MSWRYDPASERQKLLLKSWGLDCPETKGEASDIITKYKDVPKFKCRTCRKLVLPSSINENKMILKCCGFTETFVKAADNSKRRTFMDRTNIHGELDGPQPVFGTGEMNYRNGTLQYLDDGNGNVYDFDAIDWNNIEQGDQL